MEDLSTLLQKPYSWENWLNIIESTFTNVSITSPVEIPFNEDLKDKIESFRQFGTVTLADGKRLPIIELKVTERVRLRQNRVQLRQLIARLIDQDTAHGVLAVFDSGEDHYRFSFTAKESEINENGEFVENETDKKRYTYVLGINEQTRTAAEQFVKLKQKGDSATIKDVVAAFDVEPLTKEFFDRYKKYYEDFVQYITGKRFEKVDGKWKEVKKDEPSPFHHQVFESNDKNARNYIKLLLGRLVFIKFLQKKSWMGVSAKQTTWKNGDPKFIFNLYNNFNPKEKFHSQALLPLFDHLNAHSASDVFALTNTKVPALNGGLFERQYNNLDVLDFPPALFEGFLDFLEQYNFTIDESDPDDAEVGIDPEMLGHIFENLLEDNKDKGAFYTPKPIVKYMCEESIIEYLYTYFEKNNLLGDKQVNIQLKQNIERFIKKHEASAINDHEKTIAKALKEVKVCDPAIGSGAFPMGILLEIFSAVNLLYDNYTDSTSDVWGLAEWNPARIKEHIIQNSIYGVDIEKGAVDIARLRFWLSLIIDEEEPRYLPNLDYKIVVGDSLLPKFNGKVIEIDWTPRQSLQGRAAELHANVQQHLTEVVDAQKRYFNANNEQKIELKSQIRHAKLQLIKSQTLFNKERFILSNEIVKDDSRLNAKEQKENNAKLEQLAQFDETVAYIETLIADNSIPFSHFDWVLDFPEILNRNLVNRPGFDVVIGNPPYGVSLIGIDRELLVNVIGKLPDFEIYHYFTEKAYSLLKNNGILSYIIPNTYLFNTFAAEYRLNILNKWHLVEILDCTKFNIFKSATVRNTINLWKKESCENIGYRKTKDISSFKELIHNPRAEITKTELIDLNQNWGLAFLLNNNIIKLVHKIKENSVELNQFFEVSQGYIPYRRSDLIKTYGEERGNSIVDNREWHSSTKVNDEYLPEIFGRNLNKYGILTNDRNSYVWYGKHLACYVDLKFFSNKRVLVREITNPQVIATIISDLFVNDPQLISIIPKYGSIMSLETLWAVLNSKLGTFFHFNYSPKSTKGAFPKILVSDINNFPLPKVLIDFTDTVNLILESYQNGLDTQNQEFLIDAFIFRCFNLSFEEALIIFPEFPYTEDEYNCIELPNETINTNATANLNIGLFTEGTLFPNQN